MNYKAKTISQSQYISIPWGPIYAIMGSTFVGFSTVIARATDQGPISTGFYRIFLSLPLLWLWATWESKKNPKGAAPTRRDHVLMILSGVLFALDLALLYTSLGYTTVANAALLTNLCAFFTPLFVWLLTSEKPRPIFLLAATIAVGGMVLLTGSHISMNPASLYGDFLAFLSTLFLSVYMVIVGILRSRLNTPTIMLWAGVSTATCLGALALVNGENLIPCTLTDCLLLLGIAIICHTCGQGLVATSMARISTSLASLTLMIAPVVAMTMAWLLFDEAMTSQKILGATMILSSIMVMQIKRRKRPVFD